MPDSLFFLANRDRVLRHYNAAAWQDLADAVTVAAGRRAFDPSIFTGCVEALNLIVAAGLREGLKLEGDHAALIADRPRLLEELFWQGSGYGDNEVFTGLLQALFNAAQAVHAALPAGHTITIVADEPAPRVMQVEITGMPKRETTTEIERDNSGEITRSKQTERDAEALE